MKKTPLNETHRKYGAKMVDFGGWDMPIQYSSLSEEHQAVRTKAGLFDVSHMGEFRIEGPEAEKFINHVVTNDISKMVNGQAQYTVICKEDGGIIDDLLVYKRDNNKFLLCVNASNIDKDFAWFESQNKFNATLENISSDIAQIALQGPLAPEILTKITDADLDSIKYYRFIEAELFGKECIISRTGYTGEDGFEIYSPKENAEQIWNALMESGKADGLIPCGLGARDTLRLEARMHLYGNEMNEGINPIEAMLGWAVKLDKEDFIGKNAIARIKEEGTAKKLRCVQMLERAIPRQGYTIHNAETQEKIGEITSGTMSPTLQKPIGIAYINSTFGIGDKVAIQVRNKMYPAEIVKSPFYKRAK